MSPPNTQAEKVAEVLRQLQASAQGTALRDVCLEHKGRYEYSNRDYTYVGPEHPDFDSTGGTGILYRFVDGSPFAHVSGDPVRYKFRDGSAIVQHGDAWGVEGREPFAMQDAG